MIPAGTPSTLETEVLARDTLLRMPGHYGERITVT